MTPGAHAGSGRREGGVSRASRAALVALIYLAGFLLLDLVTEGIRGDLGVSLWFPPAGLTVALLLVFGWRYAGAVVPALLLHLILFRDGLDYPVAVLVLVPVAYAAIYAGTAVVLVRVVGIDPRLPRMRDVAWFVGVACLLAPGLTAVPVVFGLVAGGYVPARNLPAELLGFWAGAATGIAVLAPLLLVAGRSFGPLWRGVPERAGATGEEMEGFRVPARRGLPEALLQALVLALVLAAVYGASPDVSFDYAYLTFAPVVWIALRGGFERTVLALLVTNLGAVILADGGGRGGEPAFLQLGLLTLTLIGLMLGSQRSEQQRTERELRESERRFRSMVQNSSEVIEICDLDGTLRYASPSHRRLFGYAPEEALGTNVLSRIHPDDLPRVLEETASAAARLPGVSSMVEYRVRHTDGSWRWVESVGTYLTEDPAVGGVVINLRDVTGRKTTEAALRESERRFRSLVQNSSDMITVLGADGTIAYESPSVERVLGHPLENLVGERVFDYVHPQDRERVRARFTGLLEEGGALLEATGFRFRHADGSWRHLEAVGNNLLEDPAVGGVVINSRDVTERRKAEKALRESEERYRAIMEQSVEAIYIYDAETKTVLESNEAFQEMMGYGAGELLGMEIYRFIAHGREDIDQRISLSLRVRGRHIGERDYRRKDGSLVVVETSSSVLTYGERTAICAVSRDVTRLKEAREELEASERRFRSLIQNAPDAISVLDADSIVRYDSPATERLLGYGPDERIGKKGLDYVHPEDRALARETMREVLENPGVRLPVEYRLRHKDGSWRLFEATRTNIIDDPAVGGVVLNYRDVTERREAEKALRESEDRHRRRTRELALLHQVRTRLARELDPSAVFRAAVEAVAEIYGYAAVSAYLLERGALALQHQVGYGAGRPLASGETTDRVIRSGRAVLLGGAPADPASSGAAGDTVCEVCVPLFDGDEVVGTLNVGDGGGGALGEDDLRLMEAVAEHTSMALAQARLHVKIQEAEERFRTLVETVPAITYIEDFETGATAYDSPQIERILGYPSDTYIRDPFYWSGIVHPGDRRRLREEEERSVEGDRFGLEYRVRARDGRLVWIRDEAALVRDDAGRPIHWQGLLFDVTARRETEEQLREAEARYRTMVEEVPAITYIHTQRPGGPSATLYISPQIETVLGYDPEQFTEDPEFWMGVVHPDDRARVAAEDERTGMTGEPFGAEFRMVARDGNPVWLREEGRMVSREEDGSQIWHGVMFDISELKRVEAAFKEAERRYRTLVEQIPAVTYIQENDHGHTAQYMSPQIERMTGYPPEAYYADDGLWHAVVHPGDRERVIAENRRTDRTGESFSLEYRLVHRDGRTVWVRDEAMLVEGGELPRPGYWHGVMLDVTERRSAEEALKENEERFRALVQNSSDLISILNPDGTIRYISPSVKRVLGYETEEHISENAFFGEDAHPEDSRRMLETFTTGGDRPGGTSEPLEFRVRHRDGRWRYLEAVAANRLDHPAVRGIVLNARDVTERRAYEERLSHQAAHDPLTGLPNRRLFVDRLERALSGQGVAEGVAVLYLDLDDFKYINDSLGHEAGDGLLVAVAGRLRGCLRPEDTVARLGGDEFAVLIEDAENPGGTPRAAEKIEETLGAEPFEVGNRQVFVGASIGIVWAAETGGSSGDVLKSADLAMYEAKRRGKARRAVFDAGIEHRFLRRVEMDTGLRRVLERGELVLHYQPMVSLTSGRVAGFEALVRWRHPDRGLILPGEFVPLAEENGMIVPIGRWVLGEACRRAVEWQESRPQDARASVGVNLSAKQLSSATLIDDVERVLAATGLTADRLILEITESALVEGEGHHADVLEGIRDLGVRLAIDDFGTGYSSLSYLSRLPASLLKLDGSFLEGMGRDKEEVVLAGVVGVAHGLGLSVCAEGIETPAQATRARELGCGFAQGNYFSAPLPAGEI